MKIKIFTSTERTNYIERSEAMLTREEKATVVEELTGKFQRQRVSIFTDIRGISVAKLTVLRRELKKICAEFKVVKKTLLKKALVAAGPAFNEVEPKALEGEIGVIFGYEDQVMPAKAAWKFGKENETFKMLKGVLAGKVLEAKEVMTLAKLPPREQLLGQLVYTLQAPIQGLANVLQGNVRNLVVVISKIGESRS